MIRFGSALLQSSVHGSLNDQHTITTRASTLGASGVFRGLDTRLGHLFRKPFWDSHLGHPFGIHIWDIQLEHPFGAFGTLFCDTHSQHPLGLPCWVPQLGDRFGTPIGGHRFGASIRDTHLGHRFGAHICGTHFEYLFATPFRQL